MTRMRTRRKAAANPPTRWRWVGLLLCLLFAFGAILHVAHAPPVHAHAASEVVAVSHESAPCEPGHPAGEHCQPTSGCQLCAPVVAALVIPGWALARPPMAAAALVPDGVVLRHFHPPKLSIHA
jgi:hypothetical protein